MRTNESVELVTESEWRAAQAEQRQGLAVAARGTLLVVPVMAVVAMVLGDLVADGTRATIASFAFMLVMYAPVVVILYQTISGDQDKSDHLVGRLTQQLSTAAEVAARQGHQREVQAARQELESRLANALEMSQDEPEVIDVIERAFASILPRTPVELLLADNSHAHLLRMAHTDPTGSFSGCGVQSPDSCPAARRAQPQRFLDSEALDACPKLRGRPEGPVSGLCVPVSIMGRTVGVVHATDAPGAGFTEGSVQDMSTLSKLAGGRVGLLRMMAETQLQASTDTLTGLLNRRAFEQKVSAFRRGDISASPLVVAMADLDHFKTLNDTYGHDTGDRALRLFAQVLTGSVRAQDLICRHGGEEFVVALPGGTVSSAGAILDSLRTRLAAAITVAALPRFTVSFGVVEIQDREALPSCINRADAALFQAKREGRDRAVFHDAQGDPLPVSPPPSLAPSTRDGHLGAPFPPEPRTDTSVR